MCGVACSPVVDHDGPDSAGSELPSKGGRRFGPGLLVAAAFIGPGTVTSATLAGADYGFTLLWTVVFATAATVILQEMSARLGIASEGDFGAALRRTFRERPLTRYLMIALVGIAIVGGNAAYQAGNLTGAGLGLQAVLGSTAPVWAAIMGVVTSVLLFRGDYRLIVRVVTALVVVMSVVFLLTAWYVRPNLGAIASGFVPRTPAGSTLVVIALIGANVVPYNLFWHASTVREHWKGREVVRSLREARTDTYLSMVLGGVITAAIVVTAAAAAARGGLGVTSAADMAAQLEPLLGPAAKAFFAIGLFAAGLSSAITAPLAASYALCGVLGWTEDDKEPTGTDGKCPKERDIKRSARFRAVWMGVVAVGLAVAVIEADPVGAIVFAQAANGLLLPIMAVLLLVVMNSGVLPARYRNGIARNILGMFVVLVTVVLGLFDVADALGVA